MFKNFFSILFPVVLIVDILIVFFLNIDLSDFIIVLLINVIFIIAFSMYYIRKTIDRRRLSDYDFETEMDNETEKASIIIFSFAMICLLLYGISYLFFSHEVLNRRDDITFLNSKYQERKDLLALYIKSKLNDNEKSFFERNGFENSLFFYNKLGGGICLLSMNSSICKYWLDRVVDEVKQQTADEIADKIKEKASYLNKVEQEKQVLEKFKENNNLPASIKN
jgi:hypothetical protein